MSTPPIYHGGMKKFKAYRLKPAPEEIIGHFGPVLLLRGPDGRCIMRGGSFGQRKLVRNWCRRFAAFLKFARPTPEAVLTA
jgi:hypothetical protein